MATLIIKLGFSKSKKKSYINVTFQNRQFYSFQYVSSFCCTSCCYVFATNFISEKKKDLYNRLTCKRLVLTYMCMCVCVYVCVLVCMSLSVYSPNRCVY